MSQITRKSSRGGSTTTSGDRSKPVCDKKVNKGQGDKHTCTCDSCNSVISNQDKCIECEDCLRWFHSSCIGINDDKLFDLFSSLPGAHWSCSVCDKAIPKIAKLDQKVSGIPEELKKLDASIHSIHEMLTNIVTPKLSSLEASCTRSEEMGPRLQVMEKTYASAVKNIEVHSTVLASAVKRSMQQTEQEQKIAREKNVVIFGVSENNTKQQTLDKVQQLVQDCHLNIDIQLQDVHRLGKFENIKTRENGEKIPRPIKLCLDSRERKWDILKRMNSLGANGIFVKPDLTPEEREADFRLRTELKKVRNENPTNTYKIKRNKIVKQVMVEEK